jgi:hypothetical protein
MDMVVRNNSVDLKDVNLGGNFSNIVADLTIDKYGQVKVHINSGLIIRTSINSLPSVILSAVSEKLGKVEKNRIQEEIKKRIDTVYENRVESET